MSITSIVQHLGPLIECDTQNPPREIDAAHPIFAYLRGQLEKSFAIQLWDHGNGCVSLLATRGRPQALFNVHIDTVPVGNGWTLPALQMTVTDHRAYGRGACDIKGAAACLLALAQASQQPMAILFSSDEEGASGCCIDRFLAAGHAGGFGQIVVAEPTLCQSVLSHRGFISVVGSFHGQAGHSSEPRALADNAIHRFCHWSDQALDYAAAQSRDGQSTCFNLGRVEGGIKSNVIADKLEVNWSARLSPGSSNQEFLQHMLTRCGDPDEVSWKVRFSGPPLPAAGGDVQAAREFADSTQLPLGQTVDFWTEASLFAEQGLPALVLGPGDIAQAHAADEWVSLDQLQQAYEHYARIIDHHV